MKRPPDEPGEEGAHETGAGEDLPRLLRRLRQERGLTLREMARRLGVSERALSHYELGEREPTHSVLERYLERTPRLEPHVLLLASPPRRPAAMPGAWHALARAHGHVSERVTKVAFVGRDGRESERVETLGMRPLTPQGGDRRVRTALMRAACLGSVPVRRRIEAPEPPRVPSSPNASPKLPELPEPLVLEAEGERHAFRCEPGPEADAFDCTCERDGLRDGAIDTSARLRAVGMASHEITHPTEVLELRLEAPGWEGQGAPRVLAWPCAVAFDPARDVAAALHPEGVAVRNEGGAWIAEIRRPLVGLRYGLTWAPAAAPGPPQREAASVGAALRAVRERHGLSLRQVSERLESVSHGTVRNAEQGAEVAHATLRAYLDAFPELDAQDLLPRPPVVGDMEAEDVWRHHRDAFGLLAASLEKRVRIEADGRARVTVITRELRDLSPDAELQLRHGGLLGVLQASPHVVDRITGAAEAATLRGFVEPDGTAHHLLRFDTGVARDGLSYTVRHSLSESPLFTLSTDRLDLDLWGPGPHFEGTSHRVRFPCERLRVSVTFPPGIRPPRFVGHACPARMVPDVDLPPLSSWLPVPRPIVRERGGRITARIDVERPLVGFNFGLGWQQIS